MLRNPRIIWIHIVIKILKNSINFVQIIWVKEPIAQLCFRYFSQHRYRVMICILPGSRRKLAENPPSILIPSPPDVTRQCVQGSYRFRYPHAPIWGFRELKTRWILWHLTEISCTIWTLQLWIGYPLLLLACVVPFYFQRRKKTHLSLSPQKSRTINSEK